MTRYLRHITRDKERWDQLSWRYYGTAHGYERIILANPDVSLSPVLRAGIVLSIPVIEPETAGANLGLPPWKRP